MALPGTNGNGNGKLVHWFAGLLIPTLFGGALGWVTTIHKNAQAHAEQLAVLQARVDDTRTELARINAKLDRLLEQRRTP